MMRIGICVIAKNEAHYLKEWIAFHLIQGVSKIVFYDNASTDNSCDILRTTQLQDVIIVVPWSSSSSSRTASDPVQPWEYFNHIQRQAYMDGAKRLIGIVDFVLFIDIDEFVYARNADNLAEAFNRFSPDVGAVAINQRVFGSDGQKLYDGQAYVTTRFTRCTEWVNDESHWFKTAARPELITGFDSVHSVCLSGGRYITGDQQDLVRTHDVAYSDHIVDDDWIGLNHYMLKSEEEYQQKQQRWKGIDLIRYDDNYFRIRNQSANVACMDTLLKFGERIASKIATIWDG